ncbi:hypothetical protein AAVH_26328 [Aphelenchoides avenae]|nr:hypothetical protein AAVH_26328 [Aphelenchus avenae]
MPELFGILRENRELKPALRQRDIEKQRMDAELKHKEAELEQRDAESQRVAVEMEQKNAVILELRQQLSELQRELDDKDTKCNTQLHKKEDFIDVVVGEATHFQDRAVKADQLVATLFPLVDESRVAMAKQSEQERRKKHLTCSDCGNIVRNAKEPVLQHVRAKHFEKPFECTKCRLKFALTANYKQHFIAKHNGDMSSLKKNHRELEPSVMETAAKFFPGHYWH